MEVLKSILNKAFKQGVFSIDEAKLVLNEYEKIHLDMKDLEILRREKENMDKINKNSEKSKESLSKEK